MAWTKSGLYANSYMDALDPSNLAVDFSLTTHKWTLNDNSQTPAFQTDTGMATGTYNTAPGQVSGTGYTLGGQVITSPTFAIAGTTAVLTYDMGDQVWASPTSVTAYAAVLYADALTTPTADALLVGMWFNGAFTSTAGTFTIQFAGTGVFTITFAP